jgi:hypothetical protein
MTTTDELINDLCRPTVESILVIALPTDDGALCCITGWARVAAFRSYESTESTGGDSALCSTHAAVVLGSASAAGAPISFPIEAMADAA